MSAVQVILRPSATRKYIAKLPMEKTGSIFWMPFDKPDPIALERIALNDLGRYVITLSVQLDKDDWKKMSQKAENLTMQYHQPESGIREWKEQRKGYVTEHGGKVLITYLRFPIVLHPDLSFSIACLCAFRRILLIVKYIDE